jgi:hypothetical protein
MSALSIALCLGLGGAGQAAGPLTLATMPRIDVHTHIGNDWKTLDEVLALRKAIREQLHAEMAMWFSLGPAEPPDMSELRKRYQGRIQFCISEFKIEDGLRFSPQELVYWKKQGVVGFKFYPGWKRGVQIDQAANDPIFDKMEQIGMVAASAHVTNPCGTFGRRSEWFPEPVEFWRQQHAWENVLKKHPRLVVVNAHMLWLCYSDEQLDYLRYMLKTYPNLHVDLATTPVFLHAVGRDNLRESSSEPTWRVRGSCRCSTNGCRRFAIKFPSTSAISSFWRRTKSCPAASTTSTNCAAWRCRWTCWRRSISATRCGSTRTSPKRWRNWAIWARTDRKKRHRDERIAHAIVTWSGACRFGRKGGLDETPYADRCGAGFGTVFLARRGRRA